MSSKWRKSVGQTVGSTANVTADDSVAAVITYTGDPSSEGFVFLSTDHLQLAVGSDTDDSDASDTTITTDTPGGTDTDGTLLLDNFTDTDSTPNGLGGLAAAVNSSPNWEMSLVAGLTTTTCVATSDGMAYATLAGSTAITDSGVEILFDHSHTDHTIGASNSSLTTDAIALHACVGAEADDSINAAARTSKKRVAHNRGPNDTGNIYTGSNLSSRLSNLTLKAGATTDAVSDADVVVDFYAAKQNSQRLLHQHTFDSGDANSDVTDLPVHQKTWPDSDGVGPIPALFTEPGERLVIVAYTTDASADAIYASAVGYYGNDVSE